MPRLGKFGSKFPELVIVDAGTQGLSLTQIYSGAWIFSQMNAAAPPLDTKSEHDHPLLSSHDNVVELG